MFYCEDGYWGKYRIGEFGNHRYGNFTVREILIQSSNVGMAKIGLKMGQKRLYDGLTLFGFGKKTEIDLPGEDPGLLYPVSKWSGYSVTRIPFGHEILVNAIQMLRAYAILANGGSRVTPHIVKAVVDSQGNITQLHEAAGPTGFVIKPEVAHWIVRNAWPAWSMKAPATRPPSKAFRSGAKPAQPISRCRPAVMIRPITSHRLSAGHRQSIPKWWSWCPYASPTGP